MIRYVIMYMLAAAISASSVQQSNAERAALQSPIAWISISAGVEYGTRKIIERPAVGDGMLHIVKIDPAKAKLRSFMASSLDNQRRTARTWCTEFGMVAVINAGMYHTDYLTHVGYMRSGNHVNNAKWAKGYNSTLVFDPIKIGPPAVQILDNVKGDSATALNYGTVIQNLRLIKGRSENVWKEKTKKWSEAAIAMDKQGHILFLFIKSPLSPYEFNEKILSIPLDVTHAMHLEGGPEASLSICTNELQLHVYGSYETGLLENDSNFGQWGLPNVIGVISQ